MTASIGSLRSRVNSHANILLYVYKAMIAQVYSVNKDQISPAHNDLFELNNVSIVTYLSIFVN